MSCSTGYGTLRARPGRRPGPVAVTRPAARHPAPGDAARGRASRVRSVTVKLMVLYTQPSDPEAFDRHYFGTHMPLVNAIPGLQRAETGRSARRSTAARRRITGWPSCTSPTRRPCRRPSRRARGRRPRPTTRRSPRPAPGCSSRTWTAEAARQPRLVIRGRSGRPRSAAGRPGPGPGVLGVLGAPAGRGQQQRPERVDHDRGLVGGRPPLRQARGSRPPPRRAAGRG